MKKLENLSEEQSKVFNACINEDWSNFDEVYDQVSWLSDDECVRVFPVVVEEYAYNPMQALDVIADGEYILWDDCESMEDVAYDFVKEYYPDILNDKLPYIISDNLDYKGIGYELDITGMFFKGDNCYIEIIT